MRFVLRLAVSAVVLALLGLFLPWTEVWQALSRLSGRVWLTVLGTFLAGHCLNALKWRILVNASRSRLGRLDAIRFHFAGLFANMWLPGIVGGDVLRALLAGRSGTRPEAVVLGALADRLIDTLSMALLLVMGGILVHQAIPSGPARGVMVVLAAGALAGALALYLAIRRPLRRWPHRMRRRVGRALVALRQLGRRPGPALFAMGLSLLIQSSFVLLNAWIGWSIGINVPLGAWFLAWSLAKLAALVPISLGGLGVRDATLAALLVPFGVPAALGVVASLIWQSVLIVGGLVGGLLWWGLGRRLGDLRARHLARVSTSRA